MPPSKSLKSRATSSALGLAVTLPAIAPLPAVAPTGVPTVAMAVALPLAGAGVSTRPRPAHARTSASRTSVTPSSTLDAMAFDLRQRYRVRAGTFSSRDASAMETHRLSASLSSPIPPPFNLLAPVGVVRGWRARLRPCRAVPESGGAPSPAPRVRRHAGRARRRYGTPRGKARAADNSTASGFRTSRSSESGRQRVRGGSETCDSCQAVVRRWQRHRISSRQEKPSAVASCITTPRFGARARGNRPHQTECFRTPVRFPPPPPICCSALGRLADGMVLVAMELPCRWPFCVTARCNTPPRK